MSLPNDDEKWFIVHRYRTFSTNGLVPAVLCPDDEAELVPTRDSEGDPAFRCLACRTVFGIGVRQYEQMIENMRELA